MFLFTKYVSPLIKNVQVTAIMQYTLTEKERTHNSYIRKIVKYNIVCNQQSNHRQIGSINQHIPNDVIESTTLNLKMPN